MRFHIAGMHMLKMVVASAIAYSQGISQGDIKKALGNYQVLKGDLNITVLISLFILMIMHITLLK